MTPEKYSHIDFTPPEGAAREAERGLQYRKEFGRGGTEVGVQRARQLKNRQHLSPSTVRRMRSFFARHGVNEGKNWQDNGQPTAHYVAWLLWGGNAGRSWANKICRQMDAADRKAESWMDPVTRYNLIEYGGGEFSPEQLQKFDQQPLLAQATRALSFTLHGSPATRRAISAYLSALSGQPPRITTPAGGHLTVMTLAVPSSNWGLLRELLLDLGDLATLE